MKKNIISLLALSAVVLCVVGFKQNSELQYNVVTCDKKTDARTIKKTIEQHAVDGWEFHSSLVLPPDQNFGWSRCNLIFKKQL